MKKDYTPGEWKTDKNGERYREIGPDMIEHEEVIFTTRGPMTRSQLDTFNANLKANAKTPAERIAEHEELERQADRRICPFSDLGHKCLENCAFRVDSACAVAVIAEKLPPLPPEEMTSGKSRCPMKRHTCDPDCAWCIHGACAIKKIAKGSMKNE